MLVATPNKVADEQREPRKSADIWRTLDPIASYELPQPEQNDDNY
jgi:hypothetical protein